MNSCAASDATVHNVEVSHHLAIRNQQQPSSSKVFNPTIVFNFQTAKPQISAHLDTFTRRLIWHSSIPRKVWNKCTVELVQGRPDLLHTLVLTTNEV